MQNLLEIQNALRSASEQQLIGLLQNPTPTVPQWAVVAQMNTNKEMRDEQTRQQGLGQPTVLEGLMGAASAPTPQTNVAGMPQGVASGMAQTIASKTNVNQNTGINTVARNANAVAPVATMASGGVLKMQDGGGDLSEGTYTFYYPESMNKPPFEVRGNTLVFPKIVAAIRELGGTIVNSDTNRVMEGNTGKEILAERKNTAPETMSSSPAGARGGNTDSSLLGLPADEFSGVPLSAIPRPKGLATLGAAGDADMRGEAPVGSTDNPPRYLSEDEQLAQLEREEMRELHRAYERQFMERREEIARGRARDDALTALGGIDRSNEPLGFRARVGVLAGRERGALRADPAMFGDMPFNATSDEAAKKSVSQATLAVEPGTELAEPMFVASEGTYFKDSKLPSTDAASDAQPEVFATDRVNPFAFNKAPETKKPEVFDAQAADDLQAEAAADVAKVTSAEPMFEASKGTYFKDGKGSWTDQTAGAVKDALLETFVTDKKPDLPSYEAQLDGEFDKRVIEMRELADGIANGEYTGNGLKIAQDRIKYLNSVMEATGGAETLSEYLNDGAKQVVQKIIAPAAVDMTDFVLGGGAQVALPEALGGGVDNTAATQDYLDILQRETDGKPNIPTKPSVLESNSILDAMITNDAQTQAGSAAQVDNSLGALITDGQAQAAAVPGQILTPELNDKLAAGLETVVQNRTKEISKDGALINEIYRESELQPETNVESQIVNAEGLTAAEQLEKDKESAKDFIKSLPSLDQSVKNGWVVTPAKDTGIAAVRPMSTSGLSRANAAGGYEQKLLDILDKREKSAEQDKWLGLAEMGMRLMSSTNPNPLAAIGESGLGAFGSYRKQQAGQDAEELNILGKLADMDMAQQTLQARKEIAALSRNAKSGFTLNTAVNTQQERLKLASGELEAMQDSLGNRLEGIGRAVYDTKVKEVAAIRADLEKLYEQGNLGSTRALQTALENVKIDSTT